MMNRLQHRSDSPPDPTGYTDYVLVETLADTYLVPLSTALAIERALDRAASPDWLEFRDIFGIERRVLALYVHRLTECAPNTRALVRTMAHGMHERAQRPEVVRDVPHDAEPDIARDDRRNAPRNRPSDSHTGRPKRDREPDGLIDASP